jgi:hypothetical protein
MLELLKTLVPFCHILFTSRPHVNPVDTFENFASISIEATEEDLATYFHSELSFSKRLPGFIAKDESLRAGIITGLTKKACGM